MWALIQIPLLMLPERKTIPKRGFQQMSLDITEGSMSVPSGKPQTDAAQERSQVLVLLLAWFLGFTRFHMCLYIMCVYINRHKHKSIYICAHACMCVYIYIHIYIHTHTHALTYVHAYLYLQLGNKTKPRFSLLGEKPSVGGTGMSSKKTRLVQNR